MAQSKSDKEIFWVKPKVRGIIPIGSLHISKSLYKDIKKNEYRVTINENYSNVLSNCASREETWINIVLLKSYKMLYELGHSHSIEIWNNQKFIGGLFGVSLGSAFFAESMFSKEKNGSKLAMIALMARLVTGNFELFDTQFPSCHLTSMGGTELSEDKYDKILKTALSKQANFFKLSRDTNWSQLTQLATHTS